MAFNFFVSLLLTCTDPLLIKMEGQWRGEGERHYSASGRIVSLTVETESHCDGNVLFSTNTWYEKDLNSGATKDYVVQYWLAPKEGFEGSYNLGSGRKLNEIAAEGYFDGSQFSVNQEIKDTPIKILSKTILEHNSTIYQDSVFNGTYEVSKSKVQFKRNFN